MTNREYVKELLQVMKDNPTLEVLCKVESDIVAEDGYAWWLGTLNTEISIEIDEYSECIGETIKFRSDADWVYWHEEIGLDFDNAKYDSEVIDEVNKIANWKKAIFISITTL